MVLGDAGVSHGGGRYEWDSAPVAIGRRGLWTSRLDGSPLVPNNTDHYLPDLLVCHPDLVERVPARRRLRR